MTDDGASDDHVLDPMWAEPHEWWRRTELRDGTRVLLRQLRRQDRDRLAEGVRRLSPASRFLRFRQPVEELDDEQLEYLLDVDHVDHEAIVALDVDRPERPGIGVARYVREPYEPQVAEAAITVADEYHGLGAGTLLLGALAARARRNDIGVFRSYVLDGNHAMLEVFDHIGARRELETDGLWRVDLDVPAHDDGLPDSPAGRAFVQAARGRRRLVSLLPPIWGRRPDGDPHPVDGPRRDHGDDELVSVRRELDDWLRARDARSP